MSEKETESVQNESADLNTTKARKQARKALRRVEGAALHLNLALKALDDMDARTCHPARDMPRAFLPIYSKGHAEIWALSSSLEKLRRRLERLVLSDLPALERGERQAGRERVGGGA